MSLHSKHVALSLVLLVVALAVVGCARESITWVNEGASYSVPDAEELARELADDRYADTAVSEAYDLRQDSLAHLRGQGEDASELADLLTRVFVTDIRSVPFYAEAAQLDGVDAWLVVESWGPTGGTMASTRLWVFERDTGNVLLSMAVN